MLDCFRTRSTTNKVFKKTKTYPTLIFWSVGAQMIENTLFIKKKQRNIDLPYEIQALKMIKFPV